jgi:pyruvate formate lyase activating enzyme
MLKVCDLVMLDIKHIDNTKHLELTGKTNKNILDFAKYLDGKNQKMWLRYVLVPGFNSDTQTLIDWKNFADSLNNVEKIELLPYHTMGKQKYKQLGIQYRFENVKEPSREDILNARKILGI